MSYKVVAFTEGGVVVADGAIAAQRLFEAVRSGEATAFLLKTADDVAPAVEKIKNLDDLTELSKLAATGDLNENIKKAFSSVLGTLAAIAAIGGGPAAALATDEAMSKAFEHAYDKASAWSRNRDWSEFFETLDWVAQEFQPIPEIQNTIDPKINSIFNSARNFTLPRDPLVLDLDGDGLELKAASGNILFDHDADGIKTGTGWAGSDDGFLVRDLDGNDLIDSGRELFGEDTVKQNGQLARQGFDALADLDSNADGDITNADSAWSELQVWRDLNQDGISQSNELNSLDALNITRIGVSGSASGPQAGQTIQNNRVALSTTFTQAGADRTVGAIDLDANPFFSDIPAEQLDEAGNAVTLTEAAQAPPQMNGSGMVRNLRAAMSQSGAAADELEAALAAFAAAPTSDQQLALLDTLITEWAQTSSYWSELEGYLGGTATVNPPVGMSKAEYRNLVAVLEAFNGSRFFAGGRHCITPAWQLASRTCLSPTRRPKLWRTGRSRLPIQENLPRR